MGAMIAALSIPLGEEISDEERGGYHVVWTRNMVQSATALLAVGDVSTPLRALLYLAGGLPARRRRSLPELLDRTRPVTPVTSVHTEICKPALAPT